jgi:hypothetical protein
MKVSQLSAFTVIFRIIDVIMSAHPVVINRDKIKVVLLVSIIMLSFIANGFCKFLGPTLWTQHYYDLDDWIVKLNLAFLI